MSRYLVKNIVCDYEVIDTIAHKSICICNIKSNAELIADILNGDNYKDIAYEYSRYPFKKVKFHNTGKWEKNEHTFWTCSECGLVNKYNRVRYAYCPNCGADMREE